MNFSLTNKTRTDVPLARAFFSRAKEKIIGKEYELSVVIVGNRLSHKLNKEYKKKDRPTNVLSFALSENTGEIFLNLPYIKKEAKIISNRPKDHLAYLYIHGLLHLKGYDHETKKQSEKMGSAEKRWLKYFGLI